MATKDNDVKVWQGPQLGTTPVERVLDWNDPPCPECGAPMCDNGLIIWCDNGHVFSFSNKNRAATLMS